MFKNRSVIEIIVITFTFVAAFGIVATGALVAAIELRDPTADTGEMANSLLALIASIIGALLGLLAGKSAVGSGMDARPDSAQGTDYGEQVQELFKRPKESEQ